MPILPPSSQAPLGKSLTLSSPALEDRDLLGLGWRGYEVVTPNPADMGEGGSGPASWSPGGESAVSGHLHFLFLETKAEASDPRMSRAPNALRRRSFRDRSCLEEIHEDEQGQSKDSTVRTSQRAKHLKRPGVATAVLGAQPQARTLTKLCSAEKPGTDKKQRHR